MRVLDAVSVPAPQKLLILDIVHPLSDARLSVLSDRVARHDEKLRRTSRRFVCSSLFERSIRERFGSNTGVAPRTISIWACKNTPTQTRPKSHWRSWSVRETAIDRWARTNAGMRQEPRLYGRGAICDRILMTNPRSLAARSSTRIRNLKKAWKGRDDAWTAAATARRAATRETGGGPVAPGISGSSAAGAKSLDERRKASRDLATAMIVRSAHLACAPASRRIRSRGPLYQTLLRDADPQKSADERQEGDRRIAQEGQGRQAQYPQQAAARRGVRP